MKTTLLLAAALAAAVCVATATATTNANVDRAYASKTCATLKAGLGAATFATNYRTFGTCVSSWTPRVHAARLTATASCKKRGLGGSALTACIKSSTTVVLAPQVSAYRNAAKACAAELAASGTTAFVNKYGTNGTKANAFGKCVSAKVSHKPSKPTPPPTTTTTPAAEHFAVTLAALNGSGVSGSGTLLLNANKLQVKLTLTGLEPNQQHQIAIRGLSSGNASCPTAATADSDKNGTITQSEGQPYFGSVLQTLDQATTLSSSGSEQTIQSSLLPLQSRTIVVLGKTVNGTYDATLPVACGTITTS